MDHKWEAIILVLRLGFGEWNKAERPASLIYLGLVAAVAVARDNVGIVTSTTETSALDFFT